MIGRGKVWQIPVCLLSLFMPRDIVKIWMVKFGKPPVIHHIYQGLPLSKICAIQYYVMQGVVSCDVIIGIGNCCCAKQSKWVMKLIIV